MRHFCPPRISHAVIRRSCGGRKSGWGVTDVVQPRRFARVIALLTPLRGLLLYESSHPRLAPWAAFFRRFAAGTSCGIGGDERCKERGERSKVTPVPE